MSGQSWGEDVARLEALVEPTRRRLYEYVARRGEAVGRDEAAQELGLPRHTVKFHLDRLVEAGFLTTEYRRLTGRTGPGAGRPAKLYRRARAEISINVPARRYALVAEVLAEAVEQAGTSGEALQPAVRGGGARSREAPRPGPPGGRRRRRPHRPGIRAALRPARQRRHGRARQLPVPGPGRSAHRPGLRDQRGARRGAARRPPGGAGRVTAGPGSGSLLRRRRPAAGADRLTAQSPQAPSEPRRGA